MNPTISYIICSMPRSGTHFLGELLENTERAGKPDEYLLCDHQGRMGNEVGSIAALYGNKTLEEFRDVVRELGSSTNGVFGVTIMGGYFYTILDNYRTLSQYQDIKDDAVLINTLFYSPKYIWLIRRDKVRQAVSMVKALQTNVWKKKIHSVDDVTHTPKFNFDKIDFYHNRFLAADQEWEQYFAKHNITPFKVIYEDLVDDYEQISISILNFLNLSTDNLTFSSCEIQKQANSLSDEWVAQYHAIKQAQIQAESPNLKRRLGHRINSIVQRLKIR